MRVGKLNQSTSGILNAGVYQLVEEKILTEAATSVTFSNLNGDVDQEYRIIGRFVNGYNGGENLRIQPNNDTGANYGYQNISGINTTIAAARDSGLVSHNIARCEALNDLSLSDTIIYAKSGYVRTFLSKYCSGISGTTVNGIYLSGGSWNNTANNITSLVISASQANGLGIGTHLFLFKRNLLGTEASSGMKTGDLNIQGSLNCGVMQKIYQTTLASAATSVTISGLDGNTDTLYELRARIVNGYNGACGIYLRPNNDTTDTHYGGQKIYGSDSSAAANHNSGAAYYFNGGFSTLNQLSFTNCFMYSKSGFIRVWINTGAEAISGTTVGYADLFGNVWNNTADNITSLVLFATQASGLGVGTTIELWALRKKI